MINIEQTKSNLAVSYYNEAGEIEIWNQQIPESDLFEWVESKTKTSVQSWDNKWMSKQKTSYLSKWRIKEIIYRLPMDHKIFQINQPKKFFCDIETFVGDEWPMAETAKYPVTAITFCNENKIVTLGCKELSQTQIKNIETRVNEYLKAFCTDLKWSYKYYPSESNMLSDFFNRALPKMPLLTGWNFIDYDWQYLTNRCTNLGVNISGCSPTSNIVKKSKLPMHRMIVDYLEIYKKWDRTVDIKENDTLDYVAKQVLGISKVKYNGTIQDLYNNDFETYIFYNVIDTKLVELIDERINTLNTFLTLGGITLVEHNDAFSPVRMTEAVIGREFLKKNRVISSKAVSKASGNTGYEGAFVHEPIPGMYDFVASFDFASLYPSIMRQWNMSPESYIGNTKDYSPEQIKNANWIKSYTGALFHAEDSVFKIMLTEYYEKRKVSKKMAAELEQDIKNLKLYRDSL
jgi:DNA polymerase elongation subunit (family B)